MEVHSHTHTSRKKWTHYFWEFLMLFLAVTLGFFVENQREHYIEHQRAKAYALNLLEELKKDTARLNHLMRQTELVSSKLDTFCLYAAEKKERGITNGMLYYYAKFTTNVVFFSPNNATIQELKGSGNLRLMKNKVSHRISEYDKKIQELEKEYGLSKTEFERFENLYFQIFDGNLMYKLFSSTGKENLPRDSIFLLNPPLINDDPILMKEFTGWLKFEAGIYRDQTNSYLQPIKEAANELLALLNKEYHLE